MSRGIPNRLVVREFERIRIGDCWDPAEKTISSRQASQLELYQQGTSRKLFDIHHTSIKARNWVGSIGIGKYCIDVVPKIDSAGQDLDENLCMANLMHMVSACGDIPFNEVEAAKLAHTGKPLVLAFMETYTNTLAPEWRKGQIRDYVAIEENRPYLKGKLLFSEQFRRNLIHRERLFTRSDEFICDNQYTRLLKAALRLCSEQLVSDRVARKAKSLLPEFDEVEDVSYYSNDIPTIKVDRRFARFDKLLHLAGMIIGGFSPVASWSRQAVYSLMFDMNQVFEKFIASEFKRSLLGQGYAVSTQMSGRFLLREKGGRPRFLLRPDIGIRRRGEVVLIIDTKWKRLDESIYNFSISQSDVYQVYAYGKEYDSPRVILLYPRHGNLPMQLTEYHHNAKSGEKPKEIAIATVDVSCPLSSATSRRVLREELLSLVLN